MKPSLETLTVRSEATDHLLKAVMAVLTARDPEFLKQVAEIFLIAEAHDSPVAAMRAEAWAEVTRELSVVRDLVLDDAPPAPAHRTLTKAH